MRSGTTHQNDINVLICFHLGELFRSVRGTLCWWGWNSGLFVQSKRWSRAIFSPGTSYTLRLLTGDLSIKCVLREHENKKAVIKPAIAWHRYNRTSCVCKSLLKCSEKEDFGWHNRVICPNPHIHKSAGTEIWVRIWIFAEYLCYTIRSLIPHSTIEEIKGSGKLKYIFYVHIVAETKVSLQAPAHCATLFSSSCSGAVGWFRIAMRHGPGMISLCFFLKLSLPLYLSNRSLCMLINSSSLWTDKIGIMCIHTHILYQRGPFI